VLLLNHLLVAHLLLALEVVLLRHLAARHYRADRAGRHRRHADVALVLLHIQKLAGVHPLA